MGEANRIGITRNKQEDDESLLSKVIPAFFLFDGPWKGQRWKDSLFGAARAEMSLLNLCRVATK